MTQEGAGVVYYNQLLTAAIATFKSANPGTSTWVFDTTTAFMTAINDPTAFGAPNATCFNADGVRYVGFSLLMRSCTFCFGNSRALETWSWMFSLLLRSSTSGDMSWELVSLEEKYRIPS